VNGANLGLGEAPAYAQAMLEFLGWCERAGVASIQLAPSSDDERGCRLIPKALLADSLGDSGIAGMLIQGGIEVSPCLQRSDCETIIRGRTGAVARPSKDVNQSRWLRSLAAVRDGMDRGSAAKIGGMDRQTLRDWVHRFNASGPEGLIDTWAPPSGSGRTDRRGV
jgi:Winged helix-turn helix